MKRLVLFDIDETMISSDGAGKRAIGRVLNQHYGVPEEAMRITMSGKTDPQILREIFRACNKEDAFEASMEQILELYLGVLEDEIENESKENESRQPNGNSTHFWQNTQSNL